MRVRGLSLFLPACRLGACRLRRRAAVLTMIDPEPLRIVHVTRTPVGGIFRHILDLASGQASRGHHVGIVCDSTTGGERAEAALATLAPQMKLGIARFSMRRE